MTKEEMRLYMRRYRAELKALNRLRLNKPRKADDPEYNKKSCSRYYYNNRESILSKAKEKRKLEKEISDKLWNYNAN